VVEPYGESLDVLDLLDEHGADWASGVGHVWIARVGKLEY